MANIELSVDQLMARSREIAGVDIRDDEVVEPLTILHRAYGEEAQLDAEGARKLTDSLLRLMTNRLRMKRDFARHPEIRDQPIEGPLVVMGVARSGTTKLQKVLATSGDFNFLPFWMNYSWASRSGVPGEPLDERIADAEAHCLWYDQRSPETKLGHSFETLEPEEDAVLSEGCFVTPTFLGYADIPSYANWLGAQRPGIWFEFLSDSLKYLQWQGLASAGKPWLLKSPNYNGAELEILKVFPDARLIMAHRSPLKTLTSMCKLVQCFRAAYSDFAPNLPLIVEHNYHNMAAHLANRRAHPELPLLDVRFEDIVGALPAVLRRIYADASLTLSDDSLDRMLRWDTENAAHRHGEFKYSLAELGLEEATIRERMAEYFKLLHDLTPEPANAHV
ncbi:MAG: Sulfotransferase family [Novosphingobium sp.]|nr:Sulfotransferase family [Novosphingobium sp.]